MIVTGNTVTVESDLPEEAGIVVCNVADTEVSGNAVNVDAKYVPAAVQDLEALSASPVAPWGSNTRQDGVSALDEEEPVKYVAPAGIVAYGSDIVVDGNTIAVVAECLGEVEGVSYEAYPVGIDANSESAESIEIVENIIEVEGNAADYTYADGIWISGRPGTRPGQYHHLDRHRRGCGAVGYQYVRCPERPNSRK